MSWVKETLECVSNKIAIDTIENRRKLFAIEFWIKVMFAKLVIVNNVQLNYYLILSNLNLFSDNKNLLLSAIEIQ